MSDSFVLVNLPAFKVYLIRDRKNVWEARTQIGREARQTPTFRADMKYLVLNPDWTVPPTILAQDVLAGMRKGQDTIARKRLTILDAQGRAVDPSTIDWQAATPGNFRYTLRQPPGPDNALGRVKFIFPNQHSIFLHDTPSRELFVVRSADVQLGLHPRRAPARPRRRPAGRAGQLDAGAHPGSRRLQTVADRLSRHAAARAHRLLDRVGRRDRRAPLRQRRLQPRPGRPPRARAVRGHSTGTVTVECPRTFQPVGRRTGTSGSDTRVTQRVSQGEAFERQSGNFCHPCAQILQP